MPKVRWTIVCAGGCGTYLRVGQFATRLHNGMWCNQCLNRHRRTCRTLPTTPQT